MKWGRANPPVRFVLLFGALLGLSSPHVPVTTFYHTGSEGNSSAAKTQMSRGKLHQYQISISVYVPVADLP